MKSSFYRLLVIYLLGRVFSYSTGLPNSTTLSRFVVRLLRRSRSPAWWRWWWLWWWLWWCFEFS